MMTRRLNCAAALICGLVLAACSGGGERASTPSLVIGGSTTVLPIAQKAVEVFSKSRPDVRVSISGSGSGNGIKALIDGTTDIAMASREMKEVEIAQAEARNVEPLEHVVAWDGIVPVVHPSNPVSDLTLEQLKDIYTGKITDWKEVGGTPGKIVVVSRDSSSGTYEAWGEIVLHGERVMPGAQLQASNGAVAETVAGTPAALGYIGIGYAEGNPGVKSLAVEGTHASAETVLDKTYKIARPLYMYTNGEPKGAAAEYIDLVLSPEGQELVKEEKFVPLPQKGAN